MDPAKDGRNWYIYCDNNPLMYVDITGMWGKEIHDRSQEFGGTYQWALNMGFSLEQADIIAKACNGVDWNIFATDPFFGQSYHFNTNPGGIDSRITMAEIHYNQVESYWQQALECRNNGNDEAACYYEYLSLLQLGMSLHPIQDTYAHTDDHVKEH